jgi:LPS-assembly lipoprotein
MSSFKILRTRGLLSVFAALLAVAPLSGCVEPVYGSLGPGVMQAELQAIAVDPIDDRIGHYLAQDLMFAFNGAGAQVTPKYRLTVRVKERIFSPVVDTVTGRASSASLATDAEYTLTPYGGGAPITKGIAFGVASYDRFSQRLSNVRAARDAQIRDAHTLADQIRTQIMAHFARTR